jgi:hypothetical protein
MLNGLSPKMEIEFFIFKNKTSTFCLSLDGF